MGTFMSRIFLLCLLSTGLSIAGCGGASAGGEGTSTSENSEATASESVLSTYNGYMAEAGIAVSEGRLDDALGYYQAAAETLDETGEITVRRADAHFEAAGIAYQRYQKELAVEEYQKSVDIYLRFSGNSKVKAAVALTNMGAILRELKDKARARSSWQKALEIYQAAPDSGQNKVHMQKVQQNIQELDEGY